MFGGYGYYMDLMKSDIESLVVSVLLVTAVAVLVWGAVQLALLVP